MLAVLVPTTWRRLPILLLSGVSTRCATLRRSVSLWRLPILLTLWWVLSWRRAVLAALWRGCTVLALWWWLPIASLLWRSTVLTPGRSTVPCRSWVGLFVFGVIATVNGAEEELDNPKIGGEVNGRVRAHHFFLLVFKVCCFVRHLPWGLV